jgi:LemA protein
MISLPLILLGVAVVVVFWGIGMYNKFVSMTVRTKEAWADIDTQLKRRYDLIPNLVETVKGYAAHEKGVFDAVTQARAEATKVHVDASGLSPESLAAMAGAEAGLTQALGKLLAVAEAYPDLKANTNFLELQRELSDTENKIQAARRFYNGNARDLGTYLGQFPSMVIGRMFKFDLQPFYELPEDSVEREPVKVQF